MRYLLVAPSGTEVPWAIKKATALCFLSETETLYFCEGDDPPGGARGVQLDGERGVIAHWPMYEMPPKEVIGLLTGLHESAGIPAQGENASE